MLNTATMRRPDSKKFESVAAMTEAICRLPAVATLDWSDAAAAALARLSVPSRSCVLICSLDGNGAVTNHEATGVASSSVSSAGGADEPPVELTLRSRSERMDSIGIRLSEDRLAGGVCDVLDRLLQSSDWRSRGLGRLWAGIPAGEVVTAIYRLGSADAGRVLIAMVGVRSAEDEEDRQMRVSQLGAVMPRLVRRAMLAMGDRRTTASSWLTAREQQVLDELTLGKSVRQIAEQIGRSPHTVHDHVKSLHRKLNASSRGELVARALGHIDASGNVSTQFEMPAEAQAEIGTARVNAGELRRGPSPVPPNPHGPNRVASPGVALPARQKASSLRADHDED